MNTNLMSNIENFLQSPKGLKKSWVRSFSMILICAIVFITIMCLSFTYGPLSGTQTSAKLSTLFNANPYFINNATWLSVSGIAIMVVPFVFLFSSWMIGINQVSHSRYFHLFLWLFIFVASILMLIAIIFLIRSTIININ